MSGREAALDALTALINAAYSWGSPVSRRLKLWSDVAPSIKPAAFIFDGGGEDYAWVGQSANAKRVMSVDFIAYIDTSNPTTIGSTVINGILDAVDKALKPSGADLVSGRNTLGGAAFQCRIEGKIRKTPGDVDIDGVLWAPIKIILP